LWAPERRNLNAVNQRKAVLFQKRLAIALGFESLMPCFLPAISLLVSTKVFLASSMCVTAAAYF
jgi:hypothetical protein